MMQGRRAGAALQNDPGKKTGTGREIPPAVLIVTPNRFQGELLAMFLINEAGLACGISETPENSSRPENPGGTPGLVLVDCENRDPDHVLDFFIPRLNASLQNPFTAIFNVSRSSGIEFRALGRGVRGVFFRDENTSLLARGIKSLLKGELWYSRSCLARYLEHNSARTPAKAENNAANPLTHRENAVLSHLAVGFSREKIAEDLSISPHTVKTHIRNIYRKLGVSSRFEAIRWLAGDI